MRSAKPPSLGRNERRALTADEARELLDALSGDRLESLFVLALATGLRRGELLGLRWVDVDLAGGCCSFGKRCNARMRGCPSRRRRRTARLVP